MEHPPTGDAILRFFQEIYRVHRERRERPIWETRTHARIRTEFGIYTVEWFETATPKEFDNRPSAQVRDYNNNNKQARSFF